MQQIGYADGNNKHVYMHRFENVSDYFAECIRDSTVPDERRSSIHGYRGSNDTVWSGSPSMQATHDRYLKGYAEGSEQARKIVLNLTPFLRTVQGIRRGWKPQRYAGGNFILDNYVRGIPELCNSMSPVVSKKFASIIVNNGASNGVDVDIMFKRGIACVALAQVLESHGYRVSIKVCYGLSSQHAMYAIIDVKPFHQTFDIDRIAFFLADPSALRRLFFSWEETLPEDIRRKLDVPGGRGHPIEIPSKEIGANDLYLACQHLHNNSWHSLAGVQAWLKETLKRYGIEFHG